MAFKVNYFKRPFLILISLFDWYFLFLGCCAYKHQAKFLSWLLCTLASMIVFWMSAYVCGSAMVSSTPMLCPSVNSQWLTINWMWLYIAPAMAWPFSMKTRCSRDPSEVPRDFLHSIPIKSSPFSTKTCNMQKYCA